MSSLILFHIAAGLVGIVAGGIVIAGIFLKKRLPRTTVIFLLTTATAALSGMPFLASDGVSSAQLVGFLLLLFLLIAAYARYVGRLRGEWKVVYAYMVVGGVFFNALIATAQSFQHIQTLKAIAPAQHDPVYVAAKDLLFVSFILIMVCIGKYAKRF